MLTLTQSDIGNNRPVTENLNSPLLRVMRVPELAAAITDHMGVNLIDLITLGRTCVAMKQCVARSIVSFIPLRIPHFGGQY